MLVLAVVLWQGIAGLAQGLLLATSTPAARVPGILTATLEERLRWSLGPDFAAWQAVREHVPLFKVLLVAYSPDIPRGELKRRLSILKVLMSPIAPRGLPAGYAWEGVAPTGPTWVLDLNSSRDLSATSAGEVLAEGPNFRLLVLRPKT